MCTDQILLPCRCGIIKNELQKIFVTSGLIFAYFHLDSLKEPRDLLWRLKTLVKSLLKWLAVLYILPVSGYWV